MKKKKIILIVLLAIISPIILLVLLIGTLDLLWKLNFDKFNYDSAKEITVKYFYENEDELNKLLIREINKKNNKKCIEKPYKKIDSICYHSDDIIEFNMDAQGMLGGQYYGLKYNAKANKDLIIYDEFKETGNGNNIFIEQRIKGNWFFYYRDWDGKVDTSKIKE
jgi:hypothetical protein